MRKSIEGELSDEQISGLADAAMEIAKRQDEIERQIKSLLEQGKDQEALALMRIYLNVTVTPKKSRGGRSDSTFGQPKRRLSKRKFQGPHKR
jgi:hypothetical protein